jgi:hypothetical protein
MIVLRTVHDLNDLLHGERSPRFARKEAIRLELPGIPADEAEMWQARLNAYRNDCGCSTGAIFTCLALGAVLVYVAVCALSMPLADTLRATGVGALVIVLGGAAGKLVGLLVARLKFKRACGKLLMLLRQHGITQSPETGGPDVKVHAVGR